MFQKNASTHSSTPAFKAPQRRGMSAMLRRLAARRAAHALAVGSLLTLGLHAAHAGNDAWSTNPANANFSGVNWTVGATVGGAATGTIASGDALFFDGSSITTLNENEAAGFTISGLTFNSDASAYTIGGNSFALTGGITNLSANLQIISDALTMTAARTFTTTTGGGNLTLGGNISGAGGGVTAAGGGVLTLTGTETYTGGTTVNSGTLQVGDGTTNGALSGTSALTLGGGALNIKGNSAAADSQTVASLTLSATTRNSIILTPGSGGNDTLTITSATLTTGANSTLNFNYTAGTTIGATVGNDIVTFTTAPTLTNSILGGGYTVTDTGGTGFATLNGSKQVIRLTDNGTSGLPVSGGAAANNYFINQNYSTSSTTTPGSLVEALSGNVAANTVTVDTTGLASGANLALGANTLTLTSGIVISGANPYTITGTGGIAGTGSLTISNGANLTFNGAGASTIGIISLAASGTGTLNLSGTGSVTTSNNDFLVGTGTAASVGVINQSNGTFNIGANGVNQLALGDAANSYGAYTLSGGTLNLGNIRSGGLGGSAGNSYFLQTGGTVNNTGLTSIGRNSAGATGTNIVYITGGTYNNKASDINIGPNGTSPDDVLTVAGGTVTAGTTGSIGVRLGAAGAGVTAILNLNGGILSTNQIQNDNAASTSIVNFNGGTLQANLQAGKNGVNTTFFGTNAFSSVNIFSGGATIDSNGNAITIGQALLAPAGSGVSSIALTGNGTGYIAAPVVTISGGGGTGASAVAVLGTGANAGTITGITMTSFGTGYTGTPTVTLSGGLGTGGTAAAPGAISTAANTSGGLTKIGAGTLTLTATNTYTGGTTVNAGTLQLGFATVGASNILASGNALTLGGGTLNDNTTAATGTNTQTLGTLAINGGVNTISMTTSGATNNLTFTGALTRTAGSVDFIAPTGTTSITLQQNLNAAFLGSYAFFGTGATETYAGTDSSGKVIAATGLTSTTGINDFNSATTDYTYTSPGSPDQLTANRTADAGSFNTASPQTIDLNGANTLTLNSLLNTGGALTILNSVNGGTGTLNIGSNNELVIGGGSSAINIGAPIANNGATASAFTDTNTGILTLTAANTYTGATKVSNGATLQLGDGTTDGTIATTSGVTDNGALVYNWVNNHTVGYVIGGTGALTKTGAGTLTLTAANTYTGATSVTAGTLNLTGSLAGSSVATSGTGVLTEGSAGVIAGTGVTLTQGSSGTSILSGANTYTGATTISAGTLTLGGGGTLGAGGAYAGAITDNAAFVDNSTASPTLSGVISGTGTLTQSGTGNLTLSANNTYTGATTINAGTLTLTAGNNSGGALSGTPTITVNTGGTLVLTNGDTLGYTLGKEALIINSGGQVLNNGTAVRDTIQNTLTMTGGILGGTSAGDATGVYSFDVTTTGSNTVLATSDASGTPALISASKIQLQTANEIFNVTRGTAAPASDLIISSQLTGGNPFTKTGNGILTLTGANTYSGGTTVNAGTLAGTTASLQGNINDTAAVVFDQTLPATPIASGTYAGVISGSGGTVAKNNAGTVTLTGANTYTGATSVNGGSLYVNNSLLAAGTVSVAGGARLGGTGSVGATTVASGGSVEGGQFNAGKLTTNNLTFIGTGNAYFGNLANYTSAPAIAAGALTVNGGAGSVTLNVSGAVPGTVPATYELFSYTSSTGFSVTDGSAFQLATLPNRATGTLDFSHAGLIDLTVTGSDFLIWTGATSPTNGWDTVTTNWKLFSNGAPTTYIDPTDTVVFDDTASTSTVNINSSDVHPTSVTFNDSTLNYTVQGAKAIAGTTGLTKTGTGTLTITNTNSYTGLTALNGGVLNVGSAGALGTSTLSFGGGTLQYSVANQTDYSSRFNGGANQAFSVDTNGQNVTFASALTSSGGSLAKTGAGTLTLGTFETYTGGTTVNGGTLKLTTSSGSGNVQGAITVNTGGTLSLTNGDDLGYNVGSQVTALNIFGGTVDIATNGNEGYSTNVNLTGGTLMSSGGGTFRFNNATPGSFGVTTNASATTSTISTKVDNFNGPLNFNVASGSTASGTDLLVSGQIYDNAITKSGTGTMQLSNNTNSFTGSVTINGGTLVASSGGANAGATDLGSDAAAGRTITVGNGAANSGTLSFAINDVFGNNATTNVPTLVINSGGLVTSTRYNPLGAINLNGGTLFQNSIDGSTGGVANPTAQFQGYQFTGTVTVGGTAASTISSGSIGNGDQLSSAAGGTTFNVGVTGAAGPDLTVSARLTDSSTPAAASLTKTGAGTMALTAANNYTGTTTISAGTLAVNGGLAAGSAVTVGGSAATGTPTLTGTGTVSGTVLLSSANGGVAGTLNPGGVGTVGTLAVGATTFQTGSTVVFDFTNTTMDSLTVNGAVSGLDNTVTFSFNALSGATLSGTSYTLLTATNDMSANSLPTAMGTPSGYSLQYATGGTQIVLAAAPEPSQFVAFGLGMLGLGGLALKARKRKAVCA